ncbi:hypothetical protein B0T14DRAFT_430772 [Immersiella caudata]|uniref:Uncharacterized protein n=1 Tax=Immersiella caudata TaxID=314043 RepID=A0AA39WP87_9PEZI|nr:hypothetical protein B0T14DRAFT_430772 [Immersiella caudata]
MKPPKQKALSTALTAVAKQTPIMKTVQAGTGISGIFKIGETIKSVNEVSQSVNTFLPKVSQLVDSANAFIPTMQIMANSVVDSLRLTARFQNIAATAGIGANVILTYQGLKALHLIAAKLEDISTSLAAQTALTAQRDFPEYVHDMIRERLGQTANDPVCDHWFFLYHPDDDWYPKFYHLLEKKPVGAAFCGYTNQIDTIFVFMLAARRYVEGKMKDSGKGMKPVRFHLLIPAYQPILVAEALRVPEEIGDFVMEARTNSNKPFVWLNLPEEQRHYVMGIGQWNPTPLSWWDGVLSRVGLAQRPPSLGSPRTLGTRQEAAEDVDALAMVDDGREKGGELVKREGLEVVGSVDEGSKRHSTPLHHRQRRSERRGSRRSVEAERGERGVVSRRESRSEGKRERSSSVG